MRTLTLAALVVFAIYLLAAPLTLGQAGSPQNSSVEQRIQALTEQLRQAFLTSDVATFDKLLADDFILISGWGTTATKPEVLARLKSGKEKWAAVEISEMKVRVYGDTALVDHTLKMNGHIGDREIKGPVRAVRFWVNRNGQWQSVLVQYTPIPQRP